MIDIHAELMKAVERAGNQSLLAEKLGVSRVYVSDMVNRRRSISPKIAQALGFELTVEYRRVETVKKIKSR